jgi:hypothetical protein
MILQRELAIGALQFSLGHRPGDTENFVVIAFCVCGQKWPFLVNTKWSLSGGNVFGSGVPTGRGNLLLCSPALKPRAMSAAAGGFTSPDSSRPSPSQDAASDP